MKQFFKFVLATMTGMILLWVLFIVVIVVIASASGKEEKATIEANSILKLDLNYDIPEQTERNPFNLAITGFGDFKAKKAIGLTDIRQSIQKAKEDDNIKGIYMELGITNSGFATLEAIREALLDFKKSGKFIYSYGEIISQKSYYLATVSDKIFLNPNGAMELKGLGREIWYFKGMFEKLGIDVQDFHCGAFKSAIEPFIRTDMSEPNRQQLLTIYGDVYNHMVGNISKDRKIDTATLNEIVNNLLAETPEMNKELKLVDDVIYFDQVLDLLKDKTGTDKKKDLNSVELAKYASTLDDKNIGAGKIALIYAEGNIVDGEGGDNEIGGETFAKLIRKLRRDEKIKAIVLRINSGGGSALASDVMWRELLLAKKEKPLVVSFGDVAASGGYYMACMGDRIYAQPNTITGSIGVFGLVPNAKKMFNDKFGITFDEVEITKHGALGGLTKPLDDVESAFVQRSVERIYVDFKSRVAEGRKKDTAYIETIAQGRVWTGNQAITNGLVDELGGLDEAIAFAAKKANLKDYNLKEYPEEKTWQEKLAESFGDAKANWVKEELGSEYEVYKTLQSIKNMKGVQARMIYDLGL